MKFLIILMEMYFPLQTAEIEQICERLQWGSQVKDLLLLVWQLSDVLVVKFPVVADWLADAGILGEAAGCFESENPIEVNVAAATAAFHVVALVTGDSDEEQVTQIRGIVEELRDNDLLHLDC